MQHYTEYDINAICRCCLKNTGQMKALYGYSLDGMLRSVADLQVTPNDGLPELICFQCVLQLSRAFRFIEQCRKSNSTIREYLETIANDCNKTVELDIELMHEYQIICKDEPDNCDIVHDDDRLVPALDENDESLLTVESTFTHPICKSTELKCDKCRKEFCARKQLVRHMKIHEEIKPFKCLECDKTFAESCNLKKHALKHTGELRNSTNKPHLCSICGSSFKYSSSLSKHMKFHTGKNLLHCSHCPKYFAEKSALEIHLRCHTGDRPHVCQQCNRGFSQACNLQKHMRSHSTERPFKCPICERTFVGRDYVTLHMQTHSSEKKALCNVCGKRFASVKTLDTHMRTHSENRSYICGFENCNKTFTRLDTALVHRRIHSGEKPYSCDTCSHSFTTSTQLSNHVRTHTGEKPFACEVCPKKFASKSSLRAHSNKHTQATEGTDSSQQWESNHDLVDFEQETDHNNKEAITAQTFDESVLLFKLNENGELVPETECTAVGEVSTIQ